MTGDELDFQKVYEEFQTKIFRYLTNMVGETEAEDLTQDVFVKVGLGLENFRGDSHMSTWIYRIATNTAIDRLRRASARKGEANPLPPEPADEAGENDSECLQADAPALEHRIIRQEMNGCIREVINTLPESYRTAIVLSELEGLPDSEIAEILGISLQAAKIRLHRARARLRQELRKACVFFRDERNELACDRK